jgi:spore maturation protein CgeB
MRCIGSAERAKFHASDRGAKALRFFRTLTDRRPTENPVLSGCSVVGSGSAAASRCLPEGFGRRMATPFRIVVLGYSITSSWGNRHASTYRTLLGALGRLGHEVTFFERDLPYLSEQRDEPEPEKCAVHFYSSLSELEHRYADQVRNADAVIVGSQVPEGAEVLRWVTSTASGLKLFYDLDTPATLTALARGREDYVAQESLPLLDAYFSFVGGPALTVLEREHGVRLALPLHCAANERLYEPLPVWTRYDLGYLGAYAPERQPQLERLLLEPARRHPGGRFLVAGSSYPNHLSFPADVERSGHVPPARHARLYSSMRFTLNLTRTAMVRLGHCPSPRLFEAACSGVPIISDRWSGLERFFTPGSEILLVDTTEQVSEILSSLEEEERVAIGRRARARVLKEHTGTARARELVGYVRKLRDGSSELYAMRDRERSGLQTSRSQFPAAEPDTSPLLTAWSR